MSGRVAYSGSMGPRKESAHYRSANQAMVRRRTLVLPDVAARGIREHQKRLRPARRGDFMKRRRDDVLRWYLQTASRINALF